MLILTDGMDMAGDLIVTEAEAARVLRLSPRTLQRMRLEGGGPGFVKLTERRIGYPVASLESWVAERTVRSTSEATGLAGPR
jgi:hypothetical protein